MISIVSPLDTILFEKYIRQGHFCPLFSILRKYRFHSRSVLFIHRCYCLCLCWHKRDQLYRSSNEFFFQNRPLCGICLILKMDCHYLHQRSNENELKWKAFFGTTFSDEATFDSIFLTFIFHWCVPLCSHVPISQIWTIFEVWNRITTNNDKLSLIITNISGANEGCDDC